MSIDHPRRPAEEPSTLSTSLYLIQLEERIKAECLYLEKLLKTDPEVDLVMTNVFARLIALHQLLQAHHLRAINDTPPRPKA